MENVGTIEIHVTGKEGLNNLSPDNFDISNIRFLFDDIENLLFPNRKKNRPAITYCIENGSVKNIFKTSLQIVVQFTAVLNLIAQTNSLDGLEINSAIAIENIQKQSYSQNYTFEISTSEQKNPILKITPDTHFSRSQNLWADAELYFYGQLIDAGGKNNANIHLAANDYGTLVIHSSKDYLKNLVGNPLYKNYGVRAKGKQNLETGEIDTSALELIEIIDYSPKYDEKYINNLIIKTGDTFSGIDVDAWLKDLRS